MDFGGLQRMVHQLIRRIDPEVFEPLLCCLDRGGVFSRTQDLSGVKTYVLNRKPGVFDVELFRRLQGILRDERVDILHSQNGCSFYAALAGWAAGVKGIVHTDHGRHVPDKRSARWEDRLASVGIDTVVGVSAELTEYLAARVGVPRRKLQTIVNGVDTQRFSPWLPERRRIRRRELGLEEKDAIVGTVCRLDPVKNIELMIRSLPDIRRKVSGAKLLVIGDGPCRDRLLRYARETGMERHAVFLGSREDTENFFPIFDVYACTSLSEGTSMTILEAMACGIPVVASDVGGNRRLVDEKSGILFPLTEPDRWVQAVARLLEDREMALRMGGLGRLKAETEFNVDAAVARYETLYRKLHRGAHGRA
jgi:sugar transferase (PEP-CTERM/EpsH1 system associated)